MEFCTNSLVYVQELRGQRHGDERGRELHERFGCQVDGQVQMFAVFSGMPITILGSDDEPCFYHASHSNPVTDKLQASRDDTTVNQSKTVALSDFDERDPFLPTD